MYSVGEVWVDLRCYNVMSKFPNSDDHEMSNEPGPHNLYYVEWCLETLNSYKYILN